ncbi:hypothetical protein MOQ72_21945 [Saccharopolyspora sp. K220]|uniref:hypothetical protein n=1 Tax=Saccharopolyspora soli TaxID=2926618 RepID=UPI001F5A0B66|nr:hypothetical protein [Saccharopolyspora soli]MCI2420109.1 hypothetical protein [Saccharopolyspora soli]
MTSKADLTSELLDLTTISLRELRCARSPALLEAARRAMREVTTADVDEVQGQAGSGGNKTSV